jgi:DNA-binding MarR family transcriptional regulator
MFKKMKESHGMPFNPMQGEIAKILFKNKDKDIYQRDLEKIIGIRRSTISGILKTMEKNGLIMRIDSIDNRKVKKIILTEKALNIHSSIADKVKEMNNEIIKGISEEELIVFFNVADKIKKNLED